MPEVSSVLLEMNHWEDGWDVEEDDDVEDVIALVAKDVQEEWEGVRSSQFAPDS